MQGRVGLLLLAIATLWAGEASCESAHWGDQDSVRLQDGLVEAVIVPAWGRLMRFARIGGPNLLFENTNADARSNGWWNTGGDRVWPWPQQDWKVLVGRGWPPPAGTDGPCTATVDGPGRLCLSGSIPSHDLRFERFFVLAAGCLACTSRFTRIGPSGQDRPVAVWQIAHVGAHPRIEATVARSPTPTPAWTVVGGDDSRVILRPDHAVGGELLLQADALRWLDADGRGLELRRIGPGGTAKLWVSGDRQADGDARSMELEFTSVEAILPPGGTVELTTELRPLPASP